MQHFKTLSHYLEYVDLPRPEHPLLSVFTAKGDGFLPCPRESSPPITNDCYSISLKKIVEGKVKYGRTKFDFTNGALICIGPRQIVQWDSSVVFDQKGFNIIFHEDFLRGTELDKQIQRYGFFAYSANEALHLSPKEERQLEIIVESIEAEYKNNQDAFSKDIIVSHLATLLKYTNRFYERQFLNRKELTSGLLEQFNHELSSYFSSNLPAENGIPSIESIADQLSVSQRYLSDTLKKETGQTSTELLQGFLINEAKNTLLNSNKTIAEVAYELGFEYPTYFSRLFKKKAGVSPKQYRDNFNLN